MSNDPFFVRARRALRKPPGYLARRVLDSARRGAERPWARVYPYLLTDAKLAHAAGTSTIDELWRTHARAPFFLTPALRGEWTGRFQGTYPGLRNRIIEEADRILGHEFDLLGSGPSHLGPRLPWHVDFKTGREWPRGYARDLQYAELDRPTDVKVPWELSRCQHFTRLGQAYWLTGDERYAGEFVNEVKDWIAENPWAYGVNWACAMDVALRAISWIWGFYFFAESAACRDPKFRSRFLRALYLHGEYVSTHLERAEVNGNHYLSDGVGLVFLGLFFKRTRRGQDWLRVGKSIVSEEMLVQVTEDGVDYEQSTAYHRLVLECFATAYYLLRRHDEDIPVEQWRRLERMHEYVEAYTKPDGRVPLIGDADDGRVQKLGLQPINDHRYLLAIGAAMFSRGDFKRAAGVFADEAFWLLGPEGLNRFDGLQADTSPARSKAFPAGGVFVLRSQQGHLVIDCGEVGMRGRGGHGHNDILSFELALDGVNLISDCGAYLYTASQEWRNRFRSTDFHNVLQIDGAELNRFIAPDMLWHLHDDARPEGVEWHFGERVDYFRGGHSGYHRFTPPIAISRELLLSRTAPVLLLRDHADGSGVHELIWRFHLDPAVRASIRGCEVMLTSSGRGFRLTVTDGLADVEWTVQRGWISPSYGVKSETAILVLETRAALPVSVTFSVAAESAALDRELFEALGTFSVPSDPAKQVFPSFEGEG